MRTRLPNVGVVAAMLLAVAPVAASAGDLTVPAVWFTPGGGVAWPPAELGYGQGDVSEREVTFGGIVGVRVAAGFALEGRGHFLSTEELNDLEILHGEGNLTWFPWPDSRLSPFATAGGGVARVGVDSGDENGFAWNAGGGVLLRFDDRFGIRVDARSVSYEVADALGREELRPHTEIFVGLNFSFGGTPADADGDGIPNRDDLCADTPLGARVDATGCPLDGDADGVYEGLDRCPGTPEGARVDELGCPVDTDADGVPDGIDRCDDTAAGAQVDAEGCPVDSDGDGVFDGLDRCGATPSGCAVDPIGCPSDSDGDGVCDGIDRCDGTPPDVRVDQEGCPIEVTEKEVELLETGMIRLEDVNFDFNSAMLRPESFPALDEVGDILVRWSELRIEIGGHTDSQGSDAYNRKLSEERAQAVLDYLIAKFPKLEGPQLTAAGYGESAPVAPNDTALNRAKNRRVEFKVLNTEALRRETEKTKFAPRE
ncbi:MAG TPA: OmpA family protein [bacterium]|nr:OmpA family protein [bacterium]